MQDARRDGIRAIVVGRPSRGDNYVKRTVPLPARDESIVLATGVWERPDVERISRDTRESSRSGSDRPNWRVIPDVLAAKPELPANNAGTVNLPIAAAKNPKQDAARGCLKCHGNDSKQLWAEAGTGCPGRAARHGPGRKWPSQNLSGSGTPRTGRAVSERGAMPCARIRPVRPLVLVALGSLVLTPLLAAAEIAKSQPGTLQSVARLRYPVALALADQGTLLLVANQRSGTVSVIDLKTRRVAAEVSIGQTLTDLVAVPGNAKGEFLATDGTKHTLHLIRQRGSELTVAESLPVSPFPVSVRCDAAGKRCFVASLWSHKVTIVNLDRSAGGSLHLKAADVMPLAFAPRLEILSPDGANLIVADAFGGQLAVIDVAARRFVAVKTLPAHNIRGLAWSADGRQLVVSHQTLSPLAYTDAADAHWGSIVSNVLRSLDRDSLENPNKDILANSQLFQLGDVGKGAADPASVAVTKDGTVYVAFAGVGEVAAGRLAPGPFPRHNTDFHRLPVGIRPTALTTSADGSQLYVADTFGDAISVTKWNEYHSIIGDPVRISLGPQPPLSTADRGERLFFDARLSHDHWMSCHSCHTDGHSSDQLSDTLGDGSFGAPKRIPPLGGVAETGPWAWNGSMPDLAGQVQKSVQTTMHGKTITAEQVRELTAYLKTLPPAPPLNVPSDADAKAAIERGRSLFMRHGCDHCHVPPTYTSPKTFDVGLKDELGNHKFNPPSLRGVGQRSASSMTGGLRCSAPFSGNFTTPEKLACRPAKMRTCSPFSARSETTEPRAESAKFGAEKGKNRPLDPFVELARFRSNTRCALRLARTRLFRPSPDSCELGELFTRFARTW